MRRILPRPIVALAAVALAATTVPAFQDEQPQVETWTSALTIDQPNQWPSPTVKTPADDATFSCCWPWCENTLTGDWFGERSHLADQGIVFGIRYVAAMMDNTHGGLDTGFVGGGPLGITATVDTEKLLGLEGGKLFVDYEQYRWYNHRFGPDGQFDPTGSYVGVNTNFIDADDPRLSQIGQLYYTQSLDDDKLSVTFGKLDANVSYADVAAAGAFQNSIAMYTSTLNPFLPTYPNEATALALTWQPCDRLQAMFGWFDGTTAALNPVTGQSGPATGPRGPASFFDNDGHWFLIAQWNLSWQFDATRPGTVGAGVWAQTGRTATAGSDTQGVRDVPGWYVQWEQTLWSPSEEIAGDGGGINYFGQFGWSDPRKNPVHWSIMSGVSATGVIGCRPADAVGLMYAYSHFTDNPGIYQSQFRSGLAGPAGGAEMSLEAFYLYQWTSSVYLQPGLMWIGTPGGGSLAPLEDCVLPYLLVGVEF